MPPPPPRFLASGHRWVEDNEVEVCQGRRCEKKFSLLSSTRRHHCRWCGKVFCEDCAPPDPSGDRDRRLCKDCRIPKIFVPHLVPRGLVNTKSRPNGASGSSSSLTRTVLPCEFGWEARPAELIIQFVGVGHSRTALMQTCKLIQSRYHVPTLPYRPHHEDRFPGLRFEGSKIGEGGGGTVFMVTDAETGLSAVKLVHKGKQWGFAAYRRLLQEIDFQRSAKHPNIAPLYEAFQTPSDVCFSMKAGEGRSLRYAFEAVKRQQGDMEVFALYVVREITKALQYLFAQHRVVHRDIKPDNIVLSGNFDNVMLIDFGLAERVASDRQKYCPCGTKGFASPENIAAVNAGKAQFEAAGTAIHEGDIFSLGVVAYILVSGTRPFRNLGFREMGAQLLQGIKCEGPRWDRVTQPTKQLLEWMLHRLHEHRATPTDVLEHAAMTNLDDRLMPILKERARLRRESLEAMGGEWDVLDMDELKELFNQEAISRLRAPQSPTSRS